MEIQASSTFQNFLKQAQSEKKGVTLHLRNGQTLAGPIGGVGDHNVLITGLTGKEFYDALIRIEDLCAIEIRNR